MADKFRAESAVPSEPMTEEFDSIASLRSVPQVASGQGRGFSLYLNFVSDNKNKGSGSANDT